MKTEIYFERIIQPDDSATFEDRYPSLVFDDPSDPITHQSYLDRKKAYFNDEFHFVGVKARAYIQVYNEERTVSTVHIESTGLWGIDSDDSEDYLNEVFEDQKRELFEILHSLKDAEIK